jgi:hypothetical protein
MSDAPREVMAIPAHGTPPTSLEAWAAALAAEGHPAALGREDGEPLLRIDSLGLRGHASVEQGAVEAILFDVSGELPEALARAAAALGFELHEDEPDEAEDDDEEDA